MFHNKPFALLAYFVLMVPAVILTHNLGWGQDGLIYAILGTALIVGLGYLIIRMVRKKLRNSFSNRQEVLHFIFGVEAPSNALVPYGQRGSDDDLIEGETIYLDGERDEPANLPTPPELLPENRFRLYLGSHALDIEEAYTTMLIVETMRSGTRGVLRVLAEELSRLQLPFLLVDTTNDGFLSILAEMQDFGHAVGSMDAHRRLSTRQQGHSIPLDLSDPQNATKAQYHELYQQAHEFGKTLMQHGWQVVFRFSSYEDPGLALRVLLYIIKGMQTWEDNHIQNGEAPLPAFIILNDAYRFLPSNIEHSIVNKEPELARIAAEHLMSYITDQGTYGLYVYLASRKITGMHREALRACKLWFLKEPPAGDYPRIERYSDMTVEDLQSAGYQEVLLVEPGEPEYYKIIFRPTRTVHEAEDQGTLHAFLPPPAMLALPEPQAAHKTPSTTIAQVSDQQHEISTIEGMEPLEALAPRPGQQKEQPTQAKETADGVEGVEEQIIRVEETAERVERTEKRSAAEVEPAELVLKKEEFTREEIAWACVLLQSGWPNPHAIQEAPAVMREQALALGLQARRNLNTVGNKKANALFRQVHYKMTAAARKPYVQYAAEALAQYQARQGAPSRQPVAVGASAVAAVLAVEGDDKEAHRKPETKQEVQVSEPIDETSLAWRLPFFDEVLPLGVRQPEIEEELEEFIKDDLAGSVAEALASFRVEAEVRVEDITIGPAVIHMGIRPTGKPYMVEGEDGKLVPKRDERGRIIYETRTRVSRIMALQNDFALVLEAKSIRMEAPVPGQSYVGLEIPNPHARLMTLREILESPEYAEAKKLSKLTIALGKDMAGAIRVADLAKMPHLLIAGATGSGKSVAINALIGSIITQATPEDVRILMVDPKMVELSLYNGIPHLLAPVVVEAEKVVGLLKIAITEMERRYRLFSTLGVRNLGGYRKLRAQRLAQGDQSLINLPAIVIIIDELADLMMAAPEEVEGLICRIAQLARATGIHLVVATQRPSVDVITGLIKANIPARISFMVSSAVDSRTVIDQGGAEKLLGRGDMLYLPAEAGKPERIQGAFVSDEEAERLAEFWKKQYQALKEHGCFAPPTSKEQGEEGNNTYYQGHFEWELPDPPETQETSTPTFITTAQHANEQILSYINRYFQGARYKDGQLIKKGADGPVPIGLMFPFSISLLTPEHQLLAAEAAVWMTQRNSATAIRKVLGGATETASQLRNGLVAAEIAGPDAAPDPNHVSPGLKPLLLACNLLANPIEELATEEFEAEAEALDLEKIVS